MGEIVVEIELENLRDRNLFESGYLAEEEIRRVRIPAVADTGAVMLHCQRTLWRGWALNRPVRSTRRSPMAAGVRFR